VAGVVCRGASSRSDCGLRAWQAEPLRAAGAIADPAPGRSWRASRVRVTGRHRGKHALKFLSSLVFTHIPGNRLMHYDPNTGVCTEFRTGTNSTNGLMYTLSDNIRALTDGTVEHLENHDVTRPWWGLILLS
jgi:hypothetical protein